MPDEPVITPTVEPTVTPVEPTTPLPVEPTPTEFKVPEAYAEKGWAKNLKNTDDVYKMLDSSQELVGKKTVPFDYANATPDQIEEHRASARPENKEVYDFFEDDANPESKEFVQGMFHDLAVNPHVGKEMVARMDARQKEIYEKSVDKDDFKSMMKDSFGDDYEKVAGNSINFMKSNMNSDDTTALDSLSNNTLAIMYRFANNISKKYGAEESNIAVEGGTGSVGKGNVDEKRSELRKQIRELNNRPHEAKDKQVLLDALTATYK